MWGQTISLQKTGLSFRVTPSDITGQFTYRIRTQEEPGSFPFYQLPAILPYSQTLDRVLKYVENILNSIEDLREFKFERIGIVTSVSSTRESLPPGVLRWLDYTAKPWGGLAQSQTLLLANLFENENYHDRCHHTLVFDETHPEKKGINLTLDWQRVFKPPIGACQ